MAAPQHSLNVVTFERKRSKFAPDAQALACVGNGCPERTRCLHYRRHAAFNQRWASFDVERRKYDNCPAFERI